MTIDIIDPDRAGHDHVDSHWAKTAGREPIAPTPLSGDIETEIAIIGGGYTGLSTAYHLAKFAGIRAHVLEANRIGWGCSGRNGGFVSPGIGKSDLRGWIARWGRDEARAIFDQSREAVRLVRDILKSESIDAETTPDGYLEVAHQANRVRQLETESTFMAEMFGLSSRVVGREELRRDYLVSREAHGAILYDEAFALHPLKYALGLAKAAEARGVFLHDRSPVQDWSTHGKMHVLKTPGGRVRAREVVIATNGYTGDRLHPDMAGRLLPALSSIIVTRPLTQAERASANWRTHLPISDTRNLLFYYRLLPDGRVLFGARGAIEDTAKTRNHRREWLHRRLTDMFDPLADVSIESFWSGWVSVPFDRTPHVGRLDGQNVHYALGYVGTGVAMATYCGMLLANQIADRPGPRPSPLLSQPIPRYPLPSLRRLYQRAIYALFELQDRL